MKAKIRINFDVDVCLTLSEFAKFRSEEIRKLIAQIGHEQGYGSIDKCDAIKTIGVAKPNL